VERDVAHRVIRLDTEPDVTQVGGEGGEIDLQVLDGLEVIDDGEEEGRDIGVESADGIT
jgi:hypothetical protein